MSDKNYSPEVPDAYQLALNTITVVSQERDRLLRENVELRTSNTRYQGYFRRVISLGHDEDCLFCGFKDKCVTIALAETPAASLDAIRAKEREACAKLIEGYCDCVSDLPCDYCGELHEIAKAVRALSGDIQS